MSLRLMIWKRAVLSVVAMITRSGARALVVISTRRGLPPSIVIGTSLPVDVRMNCGGTITPLRRTTSAARGVIYWWTSSPSFVYTPAS